MSRPIRERVYRSTLDRWVRNGVDLSRCQTLVRDEGPDVVEMVGRHLETEIVTCWRCLSQWCGLCDPGPSALCVYCHGSGAPNSVDLLCGEELSDVWADHEDEDSSFDWPTWDIVEGHRSVVVSPKDSDGPTGRRWSIELLEHGQLVGVVVMPAGYLADGLRFGDSWINKQ